MENIECPITRFVLEFGIFATLLTSLTIVLVSLFSTPRKDKLTSDGAIAQRDKGEGITIAMVTLIFIGALLLAIKK